jgi:hypothetical protein
MFKSARLHRAAHRPERLAYRIALLRDAGFGRGLADTLAHDERYELHALLELIEQGCPPELAARILAPLENQDGQLR